MGYFKEKAIEIEESEMDLNFDERNYTDGAYWSELEAEQIIAEHDELTRIENQAAIEDERRTPGGW
jgi:hypothetical protein